jgi:hypothetical protein
MWRCYEKIFGDVIKQAVVEAGYEVVVIVRREQAIDELRLKKIGQELAYEYRRLDREAQDQRFA